MWQQDGLCRIQAQLGEGALCQVCREFPRLRHDYGDFMELGLELSCPEAARLILTTPPAPMAEREIPGGSQPEYDRECMQILLRTRGEALELLQRHSLEEALPLLLLYGYRVQDELDGGEASPWDAQEELKFRSTANDRKARLGRKHCFSGKITCAECGRSYVFHDKIQPNGKRRQIWECYNKKKYGSKKRFDELKDEWVGCDAKPVMDKELKAIMYSIIENLEINKESVLNTLETQLKSVIDMSEFEDYETKLKQYERVKEQRESLVDLYLDKCLTKDEFKNKCHELDRKIEDMRVELAELSKRNIEKKDSASVIAECLEFARERLQNCEPTEDFIKEILDEMVIHKDKTIEVKLRLIPDKWKFVIVSINNAESQRTPCVLASSNCRLPISVKSPFNSG
jgi:hypothetical protein